MPQIPAACAIAERQFIMEIERIDILDDLVCYCFGYSVDDILQDYRKNGQSTIMEKIQTEKKRGSCQCAIKNPKGK